MPILNIHQYLFCYSRSETAQTDNKFEAQTDKSLVWRERVSFLQFHKNPASVVVGSYN